MIIPRHFVPITNYTADSPGTQDRANLAHSEATDEVRRGLNRVPFAKGQLGGHVTFGAGESVSIAHKLGHVPKRWTVEDVSGGLGMFYRESWDDRFIVIVSMNACTALIRCA
jgi:hypothetical protein